MFGFSFGIAGSFSLGGMVANLIDPIALTASRFMLSSIIIFLVIYFGTGFKREYFKNPWRYLFGGGLMSLYFVLMFIALKTATAVSTSTIFTITPLMSGLFGWILLHQTMSQRTVIALSIGAMGAVWVIFRADLSELLSFKVGRGEVIFFIGCVAHAFYAPFLRYSNQGEPPQIFVFGVTLSGAIVLIVLGWQDIEATPWLNLPSIVLIAMFYLSVVATVLTFFALSYASMRLPAAKVMAYTYLTPSWVVLWEFTLGRGLPSLPILFGVGATVVALLLLLRQDYNQL